MTSNFARFGCLQNTFFTFPASCSRSATASSLKFWTPSSLSQEALTKLSALNHFPKSITNAFLWLLLCSCTHQVEELGATAHRDLMGLAEFWSSKVHSILNVKFLWLHPHVCCSHLQLHAAHRELPMRQRKLWQWHLGREGGDHYPSCHYAGQKLH